LKEALGRDAEDDELSLPVKVSEIVCAVGIQLFQIIDKTFAPGQAVGPIGPLLGQWMQLFLMCLQETQEVATQVLPLVSRFTITLGKQLQLHLQAQDPQEAGGGAVMTYLPAILHSLYTQSMYPPDHEFAYPSTASTRLSVINNSELDVDPAELFRGDVRKLWVKLVGKSPEMALKVSGNVERVTLFASAAAGGEQHALFASASRVMAGSECAVWPLCSHRLTVHLRRAWVAANATGHRTISGHRSRAPSLLPLPGGAPSEVVATLFGGDI